MIIISIGAKRPDPQEILQLVDALDSILESSIAVGILRDERNVVLHRSRHLIPKYRVQRCTHKPRCGRTM